MNDLLIFIIVLVVIVLILGTLKRKEGYSDKDFYGQYINPQYNWRTYSHCPYDYCRNVKYPFDYKYYPYPARFNYYYPYFYEYGYGDY